MTKEARPVPLGRCAAGTVAVTRDGRTVVALDTGYYSRYVTWTDGKLDGSGLNTFQTNRMGRVDGFVRDPTPCANDIVELKIVVTKEHYLAIKRRNEEPVDPQYIAKCIVAHLPAGVGVAGMVGASEEKLLELFPLPDGAHITHRFDLVVPPIPVVELPQEIAEPIEDVS